MTTLNDMLFQDNKNQVILSTFTGNYTVEDIRDKVDHYIKFLEGKNLRGKKVGLLVPSIPSYLSLMLAINQMGGTVVPLSWQFRNEDLRAVLDFLDPHIIFTVTTFNGFPFADVFHKWASDTEKETFIYESIDCEKWMLHIYDGKPRPLEKDEMNFICCSSGSTGTPKGLVVSTKAFNFIFRYFTDLIEINSSDSLFLNAPPNSVFGISALLNGIYKGAKVVFPDRFELAKMVKLMEKNNCNKLMSTPSIFKTIYQVAKGTNPAILKKLKVVALTGEMMTERYTDQFSLMEDSAFIGMYGSSEVGGAMFCDLRQKIEFIVYEGVHYKTKESELLLKSPAVFSHYYQNPSLTNEVFDQDGWLHTGDLVREQKNGKIEIIGRKKEMIKKGGQQVIPSEIEQLLTKHENVKQAVVIGAPHAVFGEQIIAFIVQDGKISDQDLFYFCSQHIAGYKVPDCIEMIDEIPVAQGKVDKISLQKIHREKYQGVKGYAKK